MFNKNEFNAMVARKGITKIELAKMLKISTCALYRRLKNDGCFSIIEISDMIDIFGKEDVMKAFFSK